MLFVQLQVKCFFFPRGNFDVNFFLYDNRQLFISKIPTQGIEQRDYNVVFVIQSDFT